MAKKILVVDDEELILLALEELLTPCGYEVSTASNGQDALGKVAKGKFDLLILDIIMPGMNGFDLCQKIREIEQQLGIKIEVREFEDMVGSEIPLDIAVKKKFIMIRAPAHSNELLTLYANGKQLLTAKIGTKDVCRL